MKAIVIEKYDPDIPRAVLSLKTINTDKPKPSKNQLLIKTIASVCNPSDLAFLTGQYAIVRNLPAIPGFEGVGIVEEVGEDAPTNLIGKKVAFLSDLTAQGTWAEYSIAPADGIVPIPEVISDEQAATLMINPFTAYALVSIAKKQNTKAIVITAASSQLASIIRVFAQQEDLETINIVRRSETADELGKQGVDVICQEDNEFTHKLAEKVKAHQASVCVDAVSGSIVSRILNIMPPNSHYILYGTLGGQQINGINAADFILKNKKIYGFNLTKWLMSESSETITQAAEKVVTNIATGKIKTKIAATVGLEEAPTHIISYVQKMSNGKIIIKP